jgi:hypothetical protein
MGQKEDKTEEKNGGRERGKSIGERDDLRRNLEFRAQ